jgi:hypothetical protein
MNKLSLLVFGAVFALAAVSATAQTSVPDTAIVDSAAIKRKQLIDRYKEQRKNNSKKGYRIQVFQGNQRAMAMRIRTEVLTKFPDNRVYLIYKQPTFRVRVGDFLGKEEAYDLLKELQKLYPAAFIVPDNILLNPIEPLKTDSNAQNTR